MDQYEVVDYVILVEETMSTSKFVELTLKNGLVVEYTTDVLVVENTTDDIDVQFLGTSDDELYQAADSATKQTLANYVYGLVNV